MRLPPWLWRILHSRRLKKTLICAPFILMISLVLFYVITNWSGARKFQRTVADLEAEGIPVTIQEGFGPSSDHDREVFFHPVLEAELARNDGSELNRLSDLHLSGISQDHRVWKSIPALRKWPDPRLWLDPPSTATEADAADAILKILQPCSDRFDAIVPAFDRPLAGWPLESTDDNFSHIARSLKLQRLTAFAMDRAYLRILAGDSAGAAEDVKSILKMALVSGKQPAVMTLMISGSLEKRAFDLLQKGAEDDLWNATQLQDLQTLVESMDPDKTAVSAVRGEIAFTVSQFLDLSQKPGHGKDNVDWKTIGEEAWDAIQKGDRTALVKPCKRAWFNVRPWGCDCLEASDGISLLRTDGLYSHSMPRSAFTMDEMRRWSADKYGTPFQIFDAKPLLYSIAKTNVEMRSMRALLVSGLALQRYHLQYDTYPATLAELVPAFLTKVPEDPCDGLPLRYRLQPDGTPQAWTLWPSGESDEGLPHQNPEKGNQAWAPKGILGMTEALYHR